MTEPAFDQMNGRSLYHYRADRVFESMAVELVGWNFGLAPVLLFISLSQNCLDTGKSLPVGAGASRRAIADRSFK